MRNLLHGVFISSRCVLNFALFSVIKKTVEQKSIRKNSENEIYQQSSVVYKFASIVYGFYCTYMTLAVLVP